LIAKDSKNAEVIQPILRGRDIERYNVSFADLWLINLHNGHGNVPRFNADDYPVIKEHLDQYYSLSAYNVSLSRYFIANFGGIL
jgi:hypothetical protein